MSLTWKELVPRLSDLENCTKLCWEYELLPDKQPRKCTDCGKDECVTLVKRADKVNFLWQLMCRKCRKRTCISINTWFESSRLSIQQSILIVACWIRNYTVEETASESGVNMNTVVEYFNFCREVCYVIVTNNSVPIGGEDKVVEVEESHIITRKHGKGRLLKNEAEQMWVFGGIERESKKCFIVRVHSREKNTLVPLVKHFVLPGTKVITDGWQSYQSLKEEGFQDEFVNHSLQFVSSEGSLRHTGTQNTERLWKSLKSAGKKEGRPADNLYIFQYIYFHNLKLSGKHLACHSLSVFLRDIAKVYPGYGKKGMVPVAYSTGGVRHE